MPRGMTKRHSRRAFLTFVAASFGTAGFANAPDTSLRPVARPDGGIGRAATSAEALIANAKLGGRVGFSVVDVSSGLVLEEEGARAGLPPASVTKSITALYALDVLGADHRYVTRLIATGPVSNGVLKGDLVLAGGGDPTLDTDALAGLAAKLKSAGVREVTGSLRTYGGALPLVPQVDTDQADHVAYNPTISGLNLNFNRVHFEWKRSGGDYTVTMDARSAKYRPAVQVARMSVAERSGPVYVYKDAGSHDAWSVSRGALGNGGARWLPVRKPDAYAAEVFASFARSQGIVLKPGQPVGAAPGGNVIATHQSVALRDILQDMLRYSNNMTAECVGMSATVRRKGRVESLRASAQEMSAWARAALSMTGASFVDHSGLGESSSVTASSMAKAMAAVHRQGALKPILKPFDLRHDDGSVNKAHPVKVTAKTGTLYFVSTLSGYMTARDGTELAFAIFTANEHLRETIVRGSDAPPDGARSWNRRSRQLQQKLIERWSTMYGA